MPPGRRSSRSRRRPRCGSPAERPTSTVEVRRAAASSQPAGRRRSARACSTTSGRPQRPQQRSARGRRAPARRRRRLDAEPSRGGAAQAARSRSPRTVVSASTRARSSSAARRTTSTCTPCAASTRATARAPSGSGFVGVEVAAPGRPGGRHGQATARAPRRRCRPAPGCREPTEPAPGRACPAGAAVVAAHRGTAASVRADPLDGRPGGPCRSASSRSSTAGVALAGRLVAVEHQVEERPTRGRVPRRGRGTPGARSTASSCGGEPGPVVDAARGRTARAPGPGTPRRAAVGVRGRRAQRGLRGRPVLVRR